MNELELGTSDLGALVQLFSAQGGALRFPDTDAAVLQEAVVKVKERQAEVERAEAQLKAARVALEEDGETLLKKAHRALAYLRVYAEADEVLLAKVDALSLPKLRKPARPVEPSTTAVSPSGEAVAPVAPRKRGRPRKVDGAAASLFSPMPVESAAGP
jgi:hypothetical protein